MERKHIHPDGPEFSRIIAGAWRWHTVSGDVVSSLIHTSLDQGITTFDHADIYGDHSNEELFGNVLKRDQGLRKRMEIVTKCGIKFPSQKRPASRVKHYDTSRKHIVWSVDNSLQMLSTDHIDLLLIHRPDPMMDPIEVAEAFAELRSSGKVLHFGVSNFTTSQFEMLQSYLEAPLVTNQVELSVTYSQPLFDGTIDTLMKHRVSPMAWSPLGGGNLMADSFRSIFNALSHYNASDSQLALAWLLKHPSIIFPVIGTTKPDRIVESARAINIKLDLQDWFQMLKVAMGKEMP
jgi:predicted oxidoreductase